MATNRLEDLFGDDATASDQVDVEMANGSNGYATLFEETNSIKADVKIINSATSQINQLANKFTVASNQVEEKNIQAEEKIIRKKMKPVCHRAKDKLKNLKGKLNDSDLDHNEKRMRSQTFVSVAKTFVEAIKAYQESQATYESNIRNQLGRRLKIVEPNLSDDDVEEAIDSGRAQTILETVIREGSGQIASTYQDVMSQHEDIKQLEKSIVELMEMFQDMALLIEQQGEKLNSVEAQINKASDYVESGTKALGRANQSQKSKRKYMCCCIIIGLIALLAILLPILASTANSTA
jgi:syntaxin 1B/2/3